MLSRSEYEACVRKDIESLAYSDIPDHQHVKDVLLDSIKFYYEFIPSVKRLLENTNTHADMETIHSFVYRGEAVPDDCEDKPENESCP